MTPSDPEDVAQRAYDAMVGGDWTAARLLLHPYLHWTRPDGTTVRGRVHVLTMLAGSPPAAPPVDVEVRDGQVYRWREPSGR